MSGKVVRRWRDSSRKPVVKRYGCGVGMKQGNLVRVPEWQSKRKFWEDFVGRGIGIVLEVTPYSVHVRWSNGEELAHSRMGVTQHFEVLA